MEPSLQRDQLLDWIEQAIATFSESDLVGVSKQWQAVFRMLPDYLVENRPVDDRFRWQIETTNDGLPDIVDRLQRVRRFLVSHIKDSHAAIIQVIHWFDKAELTLVERVTGKTSVSHSLSEPYETIFFHARDGMYISTVEGQFVHCNDALVKMLKYQSANDLLALDIASQLYVDQSERKVMIEHLFEDGFFDRHELRFQCADGSEGVALESCYLVESRSGMRYVVGMLLDVTDDKETEIQAKAYISSLEFQAMEAGIYANRESRRNETLQEVADHPVIVAKATDLSIHIANQAFLKVFGHRKKDLESLQLKDIFSENGWMALFPKLSDLRRRNRFHVREIGCVSKNGNEFIATLSIMIHHESSGAQIFIQITDLSENKILRQDCQALRQQLDSVVDSASIGMIAFSGDGKVSFINRYLRHALGFSKERMRNPDFLNELFTIPEQRLKFNKYVHAILAGRHYKELPISLRTRSNETLDFMLKTMPMDFRDGSLPGFLAFMKPVHSDSEIQEHHEYAQALRVRDEQVDAVQDQMTELELQWGKLIALMDHLIEDLKSPLEVISGFSALLRKDLASALSSSQLEDFTIIQTNLAILSRILDQAREFEKLLNHQTTSRLIEISLESLALYLEESFQNMDSRLSIDTSLSRPEQIVTTDPLLLESTFRQLIENSLQFTKGPVQLSFNEEGEHVTLQLEDEGPGMNAVDLDHAQEAFYADGNRERGNSGMGLGLALASHYCVLMGSHLNLHSSVKKGTTAQFEFTQSR